MDCSVVVVVFFVCFCWLFCGVVVAGVFSSWMVFFLSVFFVTHLLFCFCVCGSWVVWFLSKGFVFCMRWWFFGFFGFVFWFVCVCVSFFICCAWFMVIFCVIWLIVFRLCVGAA